MGLMTGAEQIEFRRELTGLARQMLGAPPDESIADYEDIADDIFSLDPESFSTVTEKALAVLMVFNYPSDDVDCPTETAIGYSVDLLARLADVGLDIVIYQQPTPL